MIVLLDLVFTALPFIYATYIWVAVTRFRDKRGLDVFFEDLVIRGYYMSLLVLNEVFDILFIYEEFDTMTQVNIISLLLLWVVHDKIFIKSRT